MNYRPTPPPDPFERLSVGDHVVHLGAVGERRGVIVDKDHRQLVVEDEISGRWYAYARGSVILHGIPRKAEW